MAYSKGQIITMNIDGTDREYRILTINGNIAEVVAMFDPNTRCIFNSNDVNTYSDGDLDTYLNTTWYGGLTTMAKNAIVSKTLTQYKYSYDFYAYNEITHASYAKYSTKSVKASGLVRKVYALDIEDIENYFNHKFSEADILELFWNVRTKPSSAKEIWTRSAKASQSKMAWYVGTYGYMSDGRVGNYNAARPAFTIDLSKIFTPGYSITYHANDGIPTPQNLTNQTELPTLPIVSKTNYNFVGWYYDSTFTQEAHAGDTLIANVDLYAKFIRSHITLDLSTISLPAGSHTIQMKLSDDGVTKADSELSNSVTYVQPAPTPTGETWLLNETLSSTLAKTPIKFYSNNTWYSISVEPFVSGTTLLYYYESVEGEKDTYDEVYSNGSWHNKAYRTITFEKPPTGELLTWLQANGVKQASPLIIKKGTYIWNDTFVQTADVDLDNNLNFKSNNIDFFELFISFYIDDSNKTIDYNNGEELINAYSNGTWSNVAYKTIIVTADTFVDSDFYTFFNANTTKQ